MHSTLKIGIIGAGSIAHKFAQAARLIDEVAVTAIAGKDRDRARRWADAEQIPNSFGSYEELLAIADIDLIYIATTNNFHYQNIIQCLNAGKHVICEKPMTMTLEEATDVISLAHQKNRFLMEAMWTRFLPKSSKVKQWVDEGQIGRINLAQATLGWVADRTINARVFDPALGGGALYDLGVYPIDLITYYTGQKVQNVQSLIRLSDTGIDETINLDLVLDSCFANLQCSVSTKLPEDLYLYGDNGYIHVPKLHFGNGAYLYDNNDNLVEAFESEEINGFIYEIQEAARCIQMGLPESPIASHSMTLQTSKIYDLCLSGLKRSPE